jgi:transcription initiation factor TFIIB
MASRDIYEQTFDENVQQNHNTCPECEGRVTTNVAETVCDDCGLVIEADRIDHGPEWRAFDDDRSRNRRAGSPNTVARHDRGIGTEIGGAETATTDTWGYTRPGTIRRYYGPLQHRSIASSAQKIKAKKEPETREVERNGEEEEPPEVSADD